MSELRLTLGAVVGFLLLLLGLAVAVIFFGQRSLIFPGSRALGAVAPEALGGERVWLEREGARTEAWFLPAHRPGAARRAPLRARQRRADRPLGRGVRAARATRALSVLLVEYPGYGRSPGRPSRASIGAAMRRRVRLARRSSPGSTRTRVVGWGRSLGGGAICALARERELAALVLESTFTSVIRMAQYAGYSRGSRRSWCAILRQSRLLRRFSGPVLLLHGERDEIVPLAARAALQARRARGRAALASVRPQRLRAGVAAGARLPRRARPARRRGGAAVSGA